MAVKFRSSSVQMNTAGTNQNSITVTKPSQVANGDTLLALTTGPINTITPPAGWTLMGTFTDTDHQAALYRKTASSEGASYVWGFSTSDTCGVAVFAFMGGHDVLHWNARVTTASNPSVGRALDAARDSVAFQCFSWRDNATATMSGNFGAEKFDTVSNNSGATVFRGMAGYYYGPPDLNDIVNIGDAIPALSITQSQAVARGIHFTLLIGDVEPDPEPWSSVNGDFGVELELDATEVNSTGGITTKMSGDVSGRVSAFTERGETLPDNTTEKLVDGLTSTKWVDASATSYVQYDFGAGVTKTIKRYRLTSADDNEAADPMNWTLQGSNNGTDYTILDTRTDQGFGNRLETREFNVTTTGAYRYYKLDITANKSSGATATVQLAEFRLSALAVWEDITAFVQEEAKIRITRGLQGSSGRSDFSRAYFDLKNTDGRFSTGNQDGVYYGALQRNTQVRIAKAYGTKALQLQGAVRLEGEDMCGDGVRAPLDADTSIPGDIDVRIDLEPESWRDEQMLCGVATAAGVAAWTLHMDSTGILDWGHSPAAGGTVSYKSTTAVPQATRQAIRVTVDVNNGASGSTATFYTADTIAGPWTQLGSAVTNTGTTDIAEVGGALCVGHVGSKTERGIHGLVYHFELRDGIDGTLVSDVDFTAQANGVHTFSENGNEWITVNNAVISNRRWRFHGEVSEWPIAWDPTGNWVYVSATGAGIQKRLERGNSELSALRRHNTKGIIENPAAFQQFATPYAYWPMEDGEGAFQVSSGLPGKPAMQVYGGTPEFASFSGFNESAPLPKLGQAKFGGRVAGNPSGYADIRWIMHSPSAVTANSNVLTMYGSGTIRRWELDITGATTWRLRGYDENDTGTVAWDTLNFTVTTTGEFMHCRLILDQNGSAVDTTFQAYDAFGTSLGSDTDSFPVASVGRIYRINVNDDDTVKMDEVYFGHLALYGGSSPVFTDPLNAYHYETAGERLKRLCQEEEIEFRHVGGVSDTAFLGYQGVSAPFPLLSTAAHSDDGYLTDPLDAFGVEYRSLRSTFNQAAHLTLDYDAGDLSGELQPTPDDSYLTNDFTAERGGAGSARFRLESGSLSVNPPPVGVGEYADSQSYSLAHEGQCIDIASWQVHKGTLDEERYPRVELALENLRIEASSTKTEQILRLDVGKRIDITDTPDFLVAEDIRQTVIGYEEWFDNFQHNFKLNTVPERWYEIADYNAGSRFDTEDAELYQDISASATSIVVSTPTGPVFSDDPKAYPFDVRVGGEVIRVLALGGVINTNSGFDTNVTGWTSNDALAHSTAVVHPDPTASGSALITPDGVGTFTNIQLATGSGVSITAQNEYTASGWFYNPGGYASVSIFINWRDGGGALVSTTTGATTSVAAGVWTYFEVTGTAPATAVTGHPGLQETGTPAATDEFYVWNVKLTQAPAFEGSDQGDSFNRADSATVLGSTDRGVVEAWTQNSGTWGIQTNRAYVSVSAASTATITGAADFEELSVEVPVWTSGDAQLLFRYTDDSNYIRWGGTVGTAASLQIISGGATDLTMTADDTYFTLAAGDKLSARCHGSVIECFVNDELALCVSDTTQESATRIGMRVTTNVPRFDNFYFDSVTSPQTLQVSRGVNGVTSPHVSESTVALYRRPYRGI